MSSPRNPQSDSTSSKRAILEQFRSIAKQHPWVQPLAQAALTVPAVVTATYPLDVMMTLRHTGLRVYKFNFIRAYFVENWRLLARGYVANYSHAGAKSVVLANRDSVHGKMKDAVGSEEDQVNAHGEFDLPFSKKIGLTLATTGFIATADLTCTNYWANLRTVSQLGITPKVDTLSDKLRFATLAAPTRFSGLFVGAAGVIGGTLLMRDTLDRSLPMAQYGILSPALSVLVPGLTAGPVANGMYVVRTNQLKAISSQNTVPGFWATAKKLYMNSPNKGGVFLNGALVSAVYTVVAYSAIMAADEVFMYILPEQRNRQVTLTTSKSALFQPKQESGGDVCAQPKPKLDEPTSQIKKNS